MGMKGLQLALIYWNLIELSISSLLMVQVIPGLHGGKGAHAFNPTRGQPLNKRQKPHELYNNNSTQISKCPLFRASSIHHVLGSIY